MEFGQEYVKYEREVIGFDPACKGDWHIRYMSYLKALFPDVQKYKVLDHGFALGAMLSAMVDAGIDAVGCELSQWNIDNCPFDNLKGRLYTIPGNDYSFAKDKTFDVIHSSQVVEHIPEEDLKKTFKEFRRIIKDNGYVYISTCPKKRDEEKWKDDVTHISCFEYEKWDELMKEAGFMRCQPMEVRWRGQPMYEEYKWMQMIYIPIPEAKPEVQTSTKSSTELPVGSYDKIEPPKQFRKKGK